MLLRGSLSTRTCNAKYPFSEASVTLKKHILRNNICVAVCNILKCSATGKKPTTKQQTTNF